MKQKILNQTGILLITSVLISFLVVSLFMYDKFSGYMEESVREEAQYVGMAMEDSEGEYLEHVEGNAALTSRVTLIDVDGAVLFDSMEDIGGMENHNDRPEIVEAREKGSGEMLRYSDTLDKQTYYYALALNDGKVIRIARTTDSVLTSLQSSITLMGLLVIGIIIVAFFVVQHQTKKLIDPINELDLEHPLRHVEYEELRPLLLRVHEQNKQIVSQVQELKERHEEYLAITENMKDGLVIVSQSEVLSINKAAQALFQVRASDCIRKPISRVSRNQELRSALDQALAGEHNETVLNQRGRTYQLLANPVKVSGKPYGAVILIWDITEKKAAEQMRREFSANVSHELKTPLMSISGYAELIENGMVQPQDVPEFAGRIHQEANRLTALVQDIIQLSKLEEGGPDMPKEEVDLYELTQDIVGNLEHAADKKDVSVSVEGESVTIQGVRQILYEMLFNLMDNGIKYNVDHGWLKVRMWTTYDNIFWQVEDSGIGIETEEQERVYERFYRVDKSHSRQTGGTGLGLSIVKHGALMHQAMIHTESKPGEGTKITLEFPMEEAM
ncbi:MAG: PAS domain S-box protein [Clostridia bacterium]|nr:PAS domain S-box protein [Clostridia bacterium]NCC43280.1 PAS domain S-box protein [Clostridia bacterium]